MSLTLVLNPGSSTLKYQIFDWEKSLLRGTIEKPKEIESTTPFHFEAFYEVQKALESNKVNPDNIDFVGYRIVHGGVKFSESTHLTSDVIDGIASLSQLAPLHIFASIEVIKASWHSFPNATKVAVFDTAFHSTLDDATATYPIDRNITRKFGIRKFGFHGTSHRYVAEEAAKMLGRSFDKLNAITCHLGAGSSITAIQQGQSVDTSMGFTPLAGLMMGTRSGDIDPGIVLFLMNEGYDSDSINDMLNLHSGLEGIAGTSDMREVSHRSQSDPDAELARDMYIARVVHYIGAYLARVPGVEVLVLTGGIGENDENLRSVIVSKLEHLGVGSTINVLVIPTNEELAIARECWKVGKK